MKDLFFPYYVNKGRLLDIYAILNHGYSEYEEITLSSNTEKQKIDKGEVSISAGFKLFNFGGVAADEKTNTNADGSQITEKKIQTIPSILKIVLDTMRVKQYLKRIDEADEGDFVELDSVILKINSIKMLMDELGELIKLCSDIDTFKDKSTKQTFQSFKNISKSIRNLCNGEEVIFENPQYAIVGNIFEECLYQSIKSDLIKTNFKCLCQIKRKHNNGTTLMKNTIFTKIKGQAEKNKLIDAVHQFNSGNFYNFDSDAITEITGKPVYEIEIISLYK